eukprot:2789559-Karenia_brevis.AAC.2
MEVGWSSTFGHQDKLQLGWKWDGARKCIGMAMANVFREFRIRVNSLDGQPSLHQDVTLMSYRPEFNFVVQDSGPTGPSGPSGPLGLLRHRQFLRNWFVELVGSGRISPWGSPRSLSPCPKYY